MNKFLYGFIFIICLPLMLWQWASHAQISLALAIPKNMALIAGLLGAFLCSWSMLALKLVGEGLPMNAFPPPKFVHNGPYFFFAHPIYVGFCIIAYAISAYCGSSAGFYLVSPLLSCGAAALAMGYENFDMKKRFKTLRYEPWIGLLEQEIKRPDLKSKVRFILSMYLFALFFFMASISLNEGILIKSAQMALLFYIILVPMSLSFISSFEGMRALGLAWVLIACALAINSQIYVFLSASLAAFITISLLKPARDFFGLMANSWTAWNLGPVRIINHGFYAGFAALMGFLVWDILLMGKSTKIIFFISILGLVISALWGQILEGSGRLKRPFGYFGALLGGALAFVILSLMDVSNKWEIGAALGVAFCLAQALGRLRCLVNGCCHGSQAPEWIGVRVFNPQTRASKISGLNNEPIYLSQIYSAIFLFLSSAFLFVLWQRETSFALIIGLYLILAGVGRFLEEATRGEAQTKIFSGLRVYQWLAIILIALGILFTCSKSPSSVAVSVGDLFLASRHSLIYIFIGLLFTCAFGVDFPGSRRRFSEL